MGKGFVDVDLELLSELLFDRRAAVLDLELTDSHTARLLVESGELQETTKSQMPPKYQAWLKSCGFLYFIKNLS